MVILREKGRKENRRRKFKFKKSNVHHHPPSQQLPTTSHWELPSQDGNTRGVHKFTGRPNSIKYNEAPHINRYSCPLSAFFSEVIKLLVVETNKYYHQHLHTLDEVRSLISPDITKSEIFIFLSVIIQMGYDK
jgi:hypothetical protein